MPTETSDTAQGTSRWGLRRSSSVRFIYSSSPEKPRRSHSANDSSWGGSLTGEIPTSSKPRRCASSLIRSESAFSFWAITSLPADKSIESEGARVKVTERKIDVPINDKKFFRQGPLARHRARTGARQNRLRSGANG